ncbi:MAG: dCTP deaminase [Desulfomonile tiedjei]|uniref:dCTP deaminase n=1 Tax=Desulfomonile tiedjei TaxID=2358 RepID=A0A9D6V646_9BACT|nr:dCTP deaminase [Desulfomonile tiedjei]
MTSILSGEKIASLTKRLISAKKQINSCSIDLTVRCISLVGLGGHLDFGGSEYKEASSSPLTPEKRTPDEPYGWWNLGSGNYLVQFNEILTPPEGSLIMIFPHERIVAAGISHPPIAVDKLDENLCVNLVVGQEGISIKENARVSKAVLLLQEI